MEGLCVCYETIYNSLVILDTNYYDTYIDQRYCVRYDGTQRRKRANFTNIKIVFEIPSGTLHQPRSRVHLRYSVCPVSDFQK